MNEGNNQSLIADLRLDAPAKAKTPIGAELKARIVSLWKQPKTRNRLLAGAGVLLVAGASVGGYQYWREHHRPNYELDPVDDLAEFTFLRGDFNSLPIQERLKLIKEFADRVRNASSGDSALLAAFAGGISGKAREQIQENGARLMLDMVDSSALEYAKVAPEQRGAFLEKSVIEWTRISDQLTGREDRSDEEILADVRKQTQQRQEMRKKMGPERSAKMAAGIVGFLNSNVANHANPIQSQRTLQMMSDVNNHFAGK